MIQQTRQRQERFREQLDEQQRLAQQQVIVLQRQGRTQQYRYQQEYWERLRRQRAQVWNYRNYDYYRDPYFYTVPRYRYYRSGTYFVINDYGANLIRQALNDGYQEGFRAGQADRLDGWGFDYRSSFAYRDANYGYYGLYVDQSEYNHYFRQGFRRGYEDGYYSRYRYGRYAGGRYSLLDAVLTGIFLVTQFR
ncbi:MAG: hypothetical protein ACRD2M_03450 [Terriglobales bacterium]